MTTNKVEVRQSQVSDLDCGSLWTDPDDGEIYILAAVNYREFAAISLSDGNRYRDSRESKVEAVSGLRAHSRGVKIIVEVPNGQS